MTPSSTGGEEGEGKKKQLSDILFKRFHIAVKPVFHFSLHCRFCVKNTFHAISVKATCFRKGTRSHVVMTNKRQCSF